MAREMRGTDITETWFNLSPVPPNAPPANFKHFHYSDADIEHKAEYRVDSRLYGYVVRFRKSDGQKMPLPLTLCVSSRDGGAAWKWKTWVEPRPLYLPGHTLPSLNERVPVILVEGEKKAAELHAVLTAGAPGRYIVASWPGGCQAWRHADWAWLYGCTVIAWPDCDAKRDLLTPAERKAFGDDIVGRDAAAAAKPLKPAHRQPGYVAMNEICSLLQSMQACKTFMLPIPAPGAVVDGWDCADAIVEGWDFGRFEAFFGSAAATVPPPPKKPASDDSGKPPSGSDTPDDNGATIPAAYSENAFATAFLENEKNLRYVPSWHKWLTWDGKRWQGDATGQTLDKIRLLVAATTGGTKAEVKTANASFVSGVERLAHSAQTVVIKPEQLDANHWELNTPSGIVDMKTGKVRPHDPAAFCTCMTRASVEPGQGAALWFAFLDDITQGNKELAAYLQRVAGYCALGVTSEDLLVYLFGIGSNGKSSFAEAIAHALGDYAKVFNPEVLMEAKGDRHPTDLAQFMGVRFALTSEPGSNVVWNDARVKSLTGDAEISARFMRGDFFTFPRTHKIIMLGNHMPRMKDVGQAMRRRLQMVPFRALFKAEPGETMRERLKHEASGAVLAWVVDGAMHWQDQQTTPPDLVNEMTEDYFSEQDLMGQWITERCERAGTAFSLLATLHKDYRAWCEVQGAFPRSNIAFSSYLRGAGFEKKSSIVGKVFHGLALKTSN